MRWKYGEQIRTETGPSPISTSNHHGIEAYHFQQFSWPAINIRIRKSTVTISVRNTRDKATNSFCTVAATTAYIHRTKRTDKAYQIYSCKKLKRRRYTVAINDCNTTEYFATLSLSTASLCTT